MGYSYSASVNLDVLSRHRYTLTNLTNNLDTLTGNFCHNLDTLTGNFCQVFYNYTVKWLGFTVSQYYKTKNTVNK